jgi:phage replication-related protein YjqB (UPF0714/DUF867 family)
MAEVIIDVQIALSATMPELLTDDTYCWIDNAITAAIGVQNGDQIRITRDSASYALYTIRNVHADTGTNRVRLSSNARARLGTTGTFAATASNIIFHPTYNDSQANTNSEYIEMFTDNGSSNGLAICAIHGGGIEPNTDDEGALVATLLSTSNYSTYFCNGYKQGGGTADRWHITSVEVSPRSFPGIGTMIGRQFQYAVSFHGFSGSKEVVIGGGGSTELKQLIQTSISAAMSGATGYTVRIAADGEPIDGNDPDNFIQKITNSGSGAIQLEQTLDVRTNYWQQVAQGVATAFNILLPLSVQVSGSTFKGSDANTTFRIIKTKTPSRKATSLSPRKSFK